MNIASDPEKFGLEVVGQLDFVRGYNFDTMIVWRQIGTGRLCFAEDKGCSCPEPFGDFGLDSVTWADAKTIRDHARSRVRNREDWEGRYVTEADVQALYDKMRKENK